VVAAGRAEAIEAIEDMEKIAGSQAASRIILEECLVGREVSLIMFANGEDFALMPPTRDHKRIGEGDTGPNTGGMGTFTDASLLTDDQLNEIVDTTIRPTLRGCIAEGFPFSGILFLGLMMTDRGPKLLEYNVRFAIPKRSRSSFVSKPICSRFVQRCLKGGYLRPKSLGSPEVLQPSSLRRKAILRARERAILFPVLRTHPPYRE
jgi:phosphoribosylamine--glycine ligase